MPRETKADLQAKIARQHHRLSRLEQDNQDLERQVEDLKNELSSKQRCLSQAYEENAKMRDMWLCSDAQVRILAQVFGPKGAG